MFALIFGQTHRSTPTANSPPLTAYPLRFASAHFSFFFVYFVFLISEGTAIAAHTQLPPAHRLRFSLFSLRLPSLLLPNYRNRIIVPICHIHILSIRTNRYTSMIATNSNGIRYRNSSLTTLLILQYGLNVSW